jgi:hypothetical protein
MAVSKLFTPVVKRRSDASCATEPNDQFVNAPLHADQRVFDNSTERSDNHLKLGGGAQPSKPKWEKRGNRSVPREKFEY